MESQLKEKVGVTDFLVQIENKLSKEDLLHFVASEDERMRKTRAEIGELEKKMYRMEDEIEAKAKKKIKKQLEEVLQKLNVSTIERVLKEKADEAETRRELDAIEERLEWILENNGKSEGAVARLEEQFNKIKESLVSVKTQVGKKMQASQDQVPTIHNFCITCGHREARFLTSSQMMRGSDGKLYFGDPEHPTTPSYNLGNTVYDRIELANNSIKLATEDQSPLNAEQARARLKASGMRSIFNFL